MALIFVQCFVQYDVKNNRSFLRRSKVDNVRMCDLFLGSSVNILGRQLTLVEYANEFTRKRLGYKTERCVSVIQCDDHEVNFCFCTLE